MDDMNYEQEMMCNEAVVTLCKVFSRHLRKITHSLSDSRCITFVVMSKTESQKMRFRTAKAKAAFNKNNKLFNRKLDFKFKEETNGKLQLEHSLVWCRILRTSESKSEIPGKF
jgi:hypothetical protein